jgi:hypothetical protein
MGEPATGRVTIAEISRERCSGTTPTKPRPGPSSHQGAARYWVNWRGSVRTISGLPW